MLSFQKGFFINSPAQILTCFISKDGKTNFILNYPTIFIDTEKPSKNPEVRLDFEEESEVLLFPIKIGDLKHFGKQLKYISNNYHKIGINTEAIRLPTPDFKLNSNKVHSLLKKHFEKIPDLEVFVYEE